MRKAISIALIFVLTALAYPCIIAFEPDKIKIAEIGKPVEIKVFVKLEHRRCPIALEDTNFEVKNIKIPKKGQWVKVKRGLYSVRLKVVLTEESGELRVTRECEKKGISEGTLKFKAKNKRRRT